MARKVDSRLQEIVDFLPATGEMLYDDWKQAINAAGRYSDLPLTRTAKQQGLVNYRLQTNADGSQSLFCSRASGVPEGIR